MSDILQERRAAEPDTELLSPATQLVGDQDAYLGDATGDVGRRIADDQLELFVACHPADAMLQQFSQRTTPFLAIHDIGTASSTGLLAALAKAASRKLQKLVIRRQGYGVPLATLQFVELPLQAGRSLRVYTTQIDGDTQTRHRLAQVMLAHSRLAVLLIGELPPHALDSSLQPLRDAIAAGPWPNRQLLLIPLAPVATLPKQAATLTCHGRVVVSTTPQVGRPTDAWSYISGTWNRLNNDTAAAPAARPVPPVAPGVSASTSQPPSADHAPTRPLGLRPMPSTGSSKTPLQGPEDAGLWNDYVRRCLAIKGVVECCVLDLDLQRSLAHSGTQRMADRLAAKGAMLHAILRDCANALGLEVGHPDAVITLSQHCLLLRQMPGRPRVALHLLIERSLGNLGLAREQLQQIDQALLGSSGG